MTVLPSKRTSVLVTHEVPVVASGLAAALIECSQFDVTQTPPDSIHGESVHQHFDVLVADRPQALRWLAERRQYQSLPPEGAARVLVVTDSDREADVRAALRAGVHGYLMVGCEINELINGVRQLSRGSHYMCASVASRMAESLTHQQLTSREVDVLMHMVKGCSNKIIARRLDIAVGTVKAHARAIFEKLDVGSRTQAVAVATERGLVANRHEQVDVQQPRPSPAAIPLTVVSRDQGHSYAAGPEPMRRSA